MYSDIYRSICIPLCVGRASSWVRMLCGGWLSARQTRHKKKKKKRENWRWKKCSSNDSVTPEASRQSNISKGGGEGGSRGFDVIWWGLYGKTCETRWHVHVDRPQYRSKNATSCVGNSNHAPPLALTASFHNYCSLAPGCRTYTGACDGRQAGSFRQACGCRGS